jgi:hypothetical protein
MSINLLSNMETMSVSATSLLGSRLKYVASLKRRGYHARPVPKVTGPIRLFGLTLQIDEDTIYELGSRKP